MTLSRYVVVGWVLVLGANLGRAEDWPAWRGPTGLGHSTDKSLPLKWSATENVKWKVALPDTGNSTPIVWGDRVFVTQATEKGKKRSLICFARSDGSKLWEKTVAYAETEPTHGTNPFCAASPVTDGERVVVSHGSAGVYCYDFAGKELWHRDLGKCHHIWGTAASPVIFKNLVILNFGPGERTFLIAMNKANGEDVWKVEEPGGKLGDKGASEWIGSWTTPIIAMIRDRTELVMSWAGAVKGYKPENGELLWTCRGLEKDKGGDRLTYTSPVVTQDAIVCMAGFGGAAIGLKTGGVGDITTTHRLWRVAANPQRIGSGVAIGDHLYIVNEPGLAQCLDIKTGKAVWSERVGAGVWGSLVHANGQLYVTNLEGDTIVLAAKPEFELLARNPLKERTLASVAPSGGELFIRTYKHLWCIAEKK